MKPWWKVLLVLAFVLPVGGYVVGSLAATSVDDPAPRAPMQIAPAADEESDATGSPTSAPSDGPTSGPTPAPGTDPGPGRTGDPIPVRPQVGDDGGGPSAGGGDDDDDDDGDDDAGDGDDD